MNRKFVSILLLALAGTVSSLAQGTKIGIVDADIVIQESLKGKEFFKEFEKFMQTKRDFLDAKIKEIQDKEKDFQAKYASMSEDKRKETSLDLDRLKTEVKRVQEDANREREQRLSDGLEKFRKELAPLIRQVALEKGLDLVLNYGPQSNIVFNSEGINITPDVIKKYDETAK